MPGFLSGSLRIIRILHVSSLATLAGLILPAQADEAGSAIRLTTLEWPPHVAADGSGPVADAVRAAFARNGREVILEVHPWNHAVRLAASAPGYAGVFPEYYTEDADAEASGQRCLFSRPFGSSPIGLAERRSQPVAWDQPGDLAGYPIGTVRGYNNEVMFDQLVARGKIHTLEAASDEQNLRWLAEGRIAAAVIDRQVFEHLVASSQDLLEVAGSLQFNNRILGTPDFHICFQNSPEGRLAREMFEKGLQHLR